MPRPPLVTLVPFTEDLLAAVQPWFSDPEVRRRLGGPEWPERELRFRQAEGGEEFRGRSVLRVHSWVALDAAGEPVAKIGGDVYDRWSRYDGSRPEHPVVSALEPGPAMGLAYVVDPARAGVRDSVEACCRPWCGTAVCKMCASLLLASMRTTRQAVTVPQRRASFRRSMSRTGRTPFTTC
jgi:hypothetical protein